jgi:hypothetical protein
MLLLLWVVLLFLYWPKGVEFALVFFLFSILNEMTCSSLAQSKKKKREALMTSDYTILLYS